MVQWTIDKFADTRRRNMEERWQLFEDLRTHNGKLPVEVLEMELLEVAEGIQEFLYYQAQNSDK